MYCSVSNWLDHYLSGITIESLVMIANHLRTYNYVVKQVTIHYDMAYQAIDNRDHLRWSSNLT